MEDLNLKFPDNRDSSKNVLRQSQLVMLRILKIIDYICRKNNIPYWLHAGTLLGAIRHKGFIPWDDDIDIGMKRKDMEKFVQISKNELPSDLFLQTNKTDLGYDMPWIKVRDRKSRIEEYKVGNYHKGMFVDIFPFDEYINDTKKIYRYKNIYKNIYKLNIFIKEPFETNNSFIKIIKNSIKVILKLIFFPISIKDKKSIFEKLEHKRKLIGNKILCPNSNILGLGLDVIYWNEFYNKNDIFPLVEVEFESYKFLAPNNYDNFLRNAFGDYMKLPPLEQRIPHNLGLKPILTQQETEDLNKSFEVKNNE